MLVCLFNWRGFIKFAEKCRENGAKSYFSSYQMCSWSSSTTL